MSLLFVYGTLKRGGSNHQYLAGQKFLGVARTTPGYRLFDLGGFPGLVPVPEDKAGVVGEVWEVDANALAGMDKLEGLAEGMYRRDPAKLQPPFDNPAIETYIYARNTTKHTDIGSIWHVDHHRRSKK